MKYLIPLVVIGTILYVALLWTFINFLLSLTGGWRKLAKNFRSDNPPSGDLISNASGRMRFVNYNYILRVSVSHNGFYLYVMKIFRPFHPPLFIPWGSVRKVEKKSLFWQKYIKLEVNTGNGIFSFMLSEKVLTSPMWAVPPVENSYHA